MLPDFKLHHYPVESIADIKAENCNGMIQKMVTLRQRTRYHRLCIWRGAPLTFARSIVLFRRRMGVVLECHEHSGPAITDSSNRQGYPIGGVTVSTGSFAAERHAGV